ncbi:Ark- serine/threonine protein kinase [Cytospora paraplurivora]|uniref:non-specific serine/threonine protein kinase n=1 Tax=Cytospora paraplurivora TaxID=2898453 RepID=A0AAN9YG58_9PEZI
MASYGPSAPVAAPRHGQGVAYGAPMPVVPGPAAPAGTFVPGTKIQVGSHRVVIQKYLSEGGFAHVYLVKMPTPVDGTDLAVLKRVAVPDKEALRGMRIEVETMKRLKGHRPIVTYIDSHASELKGGGYEVFLLMEYCNGGGLIDFMNTRLQHRLTEPEILQIFTDVAEGVACMHYLKPPLLHRDLKVENVLFISTGSKKKFKLCDFGSAAAPRLAPTTVQECRLVDEDVQKHTTMQYRSPEMVDVYRKQPIDEKSDIWALGVLLYKLCYYTTPFEEQGQLAILNASYRFPSYPAFSERLKKLIGASSLRGGHSSMLKETPQARPNIYQVLKEACAMQGRDVPIKDIYAGRSSSEPQDASRQAASLPAVSVGAVFSPPPQNETVIPDIAPMRRGRLPASSAQPVAAAKPSPSPMRVDNGDPFAALDSAYAAKRIDELSNKFPTLDQFSILHEKGAKFDFEHTGSKVAANQQADDGFTVPQSQSAKAPVTNRQAADVGRGGHIPSTSPERQAGLPSVQSASVPSRSAEMSRASSIIRNTPELQAISSGLHPAPSSDLPLDEETNIESNVDFLRSMEEPQPRRSLDSKRSSLPSISKKSIFAGKFGDAFKRFESTHTGASPPARTPSPFKPLERDLTPITGSDATDGRSDDGRVVGDADELTPEMRRDLEQQQLEEEERRVAAAQAEYRARVSQRGEGGKPTPPPVAGSSRAIAIQNKVQSLLDENARSSTNVKRTAEGYGQYTEPAADSTPPAVDSRPEVPRKPLVTGRGSTSTPRPVSVSNSLNQATVGSPGSDSYSSRPVPPPKDAGTRPAAPPKPGHLNRALTNGSSSSNANTLASSPPKAAVNTTGMRQTGRLEALLAADLPGQPVLDMTAQEKDDYLRDFSKRFPSLTSIEMVERDLAAEDSNRPGR